jgi:uncharacterized FlaG/YvyC family protein
MIDPVQAPTGAAPSASPPDASGSAATTDVGAVASAQKSAASTNTNPSASTAKAADAAGSSGSSSNSSGDSQAASDAAQPLRLLIEHDKATNHYVYKLYDSSGRIVREIPQESLADAQKQAAGYTGSLLDTKA